MTNDKILKAARIIMSNPFAYTTAQVRNARRIVSDPSDQVQRLMLPILAQQREQLAKDWSEVGY